MHEIVTMGQLVFARVKREEGNLQQKIVLWLNCLAMNYLLPGYRVSDSLLCETDAMRFKLKFWGLQRFCFSVGILSDIMGKMDFRGIFSGFKGISGNFHRLHGPD